LVAIDDRRTGFMITHAGLKTPDASATNFMLFPRTGFRTAPEAFSTSNPPRNE
jgi:hypothetical protein